MSYRQLVWRNIVRALINSPFYFQLPLHERVELVKSLVGY